MPKNLPESVQKALIDSAHLILSRILPQYHITMIVLWKGEKADEAECALVSSYTSPESVVRTLQHILQKLLRAKGEQHGNAHGIEP